MKFTTVILFGFILLLLTSSAFAEWSKPEFRIMQGYRYDFREDNHELYVSRFSFALDYIMEKKSLFKITPFLEMRRNIQRNQWGRKEAGIEIGKDIYKWLYLGEAVQKGWMNEEDYQYRQYYQKRDYTESVTKLCFSHSLLSSGPNPIKVFALSELTYDFDESRAVRNEIAVGFSAPLSKFVETQLNWRHVDRIHYYDSDTAEASLTLIF